MHLHEDIEIMKNRIWLTKKSRMEAEARMRRNNSISNALVAYYTFFVLGFSIWALILDVTSKSTIYVNVAAAIASVGLFGLSLLIANFNYNEKATQYKHSYISLDDLENKIKHFQRTLPFINDENKLNELSSLEKEYNNILSRTENHDEIDFIRILNADDERFTNQMKRKSFLKSVFNKVRVITFFVMPLLIVIVVVIKFSN